MHYEYDHAFQLYLSVYIQPQEQIKPRTLCPGDTLSYNCSLWTYTWNPRLQWHVRYPKQEPVIVSYTGASYRHWPRYFGPSTKSTLTEYSTSRAPFMVSEITLVVMRHVPIYGTEVKCTVDDMDPTSIKIKHRVLNQGIYMQ